MDNEMKAKVDEFLKNNGSMRELSMDDMAKVSGGEKGYAAAIDGKGYREDFVLELGRSMASTFGYDVAADTLCAMFGISKNEQSHTRRGSDVDRIEVLVNRIFEINDHVNESGSGKTF